MPTPEARSIDARCPFFKKDTNMTVTCEGLTDGATIHNRFMTARDCSIQFDTFCAGCFERCELYGAIVQAKYLPDVES